MSDAEGRGRILARRWIASSVRSCATAAAASTAPPLRSDQDRQTRNTERTRRAILDSAAGAISERGTAVTLSQIAAVGVSKNGLVHRFSSRDESIAAVVDDANTRFREFVVEHLDLAENRSGKMLRTYVRALTVGPTSRPNSSPQPPSGTGCSRYPRWQPPWKPMRHVAEAILTRRAEHRSHPARAQSSRGACGDSCRKDQTLPFSEGPRPSMPAGST